MFQFPLKFSVVRWARENLTKTRARRVLAYVVRGKGIKGASSSLFVLVSCFFDSLLHASSVDELHFFIQE
jgi:hypothetical protein